MHEESREISERERETKGVNCATASTFVCGCE
jgi:hypothetical protein